VLHLKHSKTYFIQESNAQRRNDELRHHDIFEWTKHGPESLVKDLSSFDFALIIHESASHRDECEQNERYEKCDQEDRKLGVVRKSWTIPTIETLKEGHQERHHHKKDGHEFEKPLHQNNCIKIFLD